MGDSKIKAQVTVEFTIALICLVLLLAGTANMFAWFANTIVGRHKAYEDTRTKAGTAGTTASQINFYTPNKLVIFDKGQ